MRRTAHVARLLADAGTVALVIARQPVRAPTATSRASSTRRRACSSSRSSSTRRWRCASGATRRASTRGRARGEIQGLTGVDDPYEPPAEPDLVVRPDRPDVLVDEVFALLRHRGLAE